MYRKFKPPFFWPAIAEDRESCQSHFCLMKNPLLYRSAWPESSREASERFLMETLGKNYRPIRQHSGSSRTLYKLVEEQVPILIATPAALLQKVIVIEGAPLLRVYGSKAHRGFESLSPPVRLPS